MWGWGMGGVKRFGISVALAVLGVFVGGLAAGWFVAADPVFASDPAGVARAKKFELVDDHGAVHASLEMMEGGGPALTFYDVDHKVRVVFDMSASGDPRLFLFDQDERIRTVFGLGFEKDGSPFLRLRDKDKKLIWSAP